MSRFLCGVPVQGLSACFAVYGFASTLQSLVLNNVSYPLPMVAVILFQLIACILILIDNAEFLNSVRQLTIFATIMAAAASIIVPDYLSASKIDNVSNVKNSSFLFEFINDFMKRFFYVSYVFFFIIQTMLLDRQINAIEQETGVFLDDSFLFKHLKCALYGIISLVKAILDIFALPIKYYFSLSIETHLLIFIYMFESTFIIVRFNMFDFSKRVEGVLAVHTMFNFSTFLIFALITAVPDDEHSVLSIFIALITAINNVLHYAVQLHSTELFTKPDKNFIKVASELFVMSLDQNPEELNINRFMLNLFAICVAVVKCYVFQRMIRKR